MPGGSVDGHVAHLLAGQLLGKEEQTAHVENVALGPEALLVARGLYQIDSRSQPRQLQRVLVFLAVGARSVLLAHGDGLLVAHNQWYNLAVTIVRTYIERSRSVGVQPPQGDGKGTRVAQSVRLNLGGRVGKHHFALGPQVEAGSREPLLRGAHYVHVAPFGPFGYDFLTVLILGFGRLVVHRAHRLIARYGYVGHFGHVGVGCHQRVAALEQPVAKQVVVVLSHLKVEHAGSTAVAVGQIVVAYLLFAAQLVADDVQQVVAEHLAVLSGLDKRLIVAVVVRGQRVHVGQGLGQVVLRCLLVVVAKRVVMFVDAAQHHAQHGFQGGILAAETVVEGGQPAYLRL